MIYFLAVLAVWRITHMLAREAGPWEVIWKIRKRVDGTEFAILMDCISCSSIWIALPVGTLLGSNTSEKLLLWLALSAGSILLERLFDGMLRPGA